MMNNRRLGRGISELLGDSGDIENNSPIAQKMPASQQLTIPVNLLHPSKLQPREIFDEESLKELANSIITNGIIQPILVRKDREKRGYEIIAGERRWRASIIAKLKEIPVIIKEINDQQCLELSIIENIQRQDLTSVEEAEAYKKLIDQFLYKHEELATIMGKSRSHITNTIRILSLPDAVKSMINQKMLSFSHARTLINIENAEEVAKKIVSKGLNVRQTEILIRKLQNVNDKKSVEKQVKSEDIINLEKALHEKLGLSVKIEESGGKGTVNIKFNDVAQLNLILKNLNS